MPAQYDSITEVYNTAAELPARLLERQTIVNAIKPIIGGKKVLDFACGSGYLTHLDLNYGASHVVGVDISPKMIESALQQARPQDSGKIRYEVHDCRIPREIPEGPFDIVTALYGLNYANNSKELADMFRFTAQNLKSDGVLLAIVPTAFEDLDSIARRSEQKSSLKYGVSWETKEKVGLTEDDPEGYRVIVIGHVKPEPVRLNTIVLLKSVYEKAAREGGMNGKLEWRPLAFNDPEVNAKLGVDDAYWDVARSSPHCSLLVVEK